MKILKKNQLLIIVSVIGALMFGGLVWVLTRPGPLDAFAQCLTEQRVTFYGAFWCPACREQKAMFGRSQKKLPYVECSMPDAQRQNERCSGLGIESYPTWEFADGERQKGLMTVRALAEKTGCELPE